MCCEQHSIGLRKRKTAGIGSPLYQIGSTLNWGSGVSYLRVWKVAIRLMTV